MRIKTYWYYWLKSSSLSLQSLLATRLASFLFILGKFARFFLFIAFLLAIKEKIQHVAGYSIDQLIIFFLIFNAFDMLGQIFFRGIYWFRNDIVSGNFDFKLIKPINPLFQVLTKHTDFLDIPLFLLVTVFLIIKLPAISFQQLLIFFLISLTSFILILSIHIIVASIGVITTEVDHTIWIFRDLAEMARVPVDIYVKGIKIFLTYIIPVALIFTFPAKSLLNILAFPAILTSILISLVFYYFSLRFWKYALTQYSSASS